MSEQDETLFEKCDLYVVFGPSGAGKSTLAKHIPTRPDRPDYVYLDADLLNWLQLGDEKTAATWLLLCSRISQCGRPCVLFSCLQPEILEKPTRSRERFRKIHYFALYCSDEELEARLNRRIRETPYGSPEMIPGNEGLV